MGSSNASRNGRGGTVSGARHAKHAFDPTSALQRELVSLSTHKVGGIRGVAVKCLDITKNSDCEGSSLERN